MQICTPSRRNSQQIQPASNFDGVFLQSKTNPLIKNKQKQFAQNQTIQEQKNIEPLKQRQKKFKINNSQFFKDSRLNLILQCEQNESHTTSRKTKTEPNFQGFQEGIKQFITSKTDRKKIQQQQQEKRLRVKQYVQRLKSMSPDQTTLQRIKKVKEQMIINQKLLQINKNLGSSKQSKKKSQIFSRKHLNHKTQENQFESQRENSKSIEKIKRVKTQFITSKILQNKRENKLNRQIVNKQDIKYSPQTYSNQKQKLKCSSSLNILPKKQRSFTLPSIERKSKKKSPKRIQNIREYKNYLLDLKLKPKQPISDYEKIKRDLKYPTQILRQFGKRSDQIQKNIMTKIKEYKNLHLIEKYQKNLIKQMEVDQLFKKNLQVKLACLMDN